ncbi:MAG TPA: cation:proton antiporter [Gemmatimonadales bacterium]|nr:cation:proton antiporter [Gemmatimonadales bacterium]
MTGHPVGEVFLGLAVILSGARLGGHVADRLGQPAVLGELVVGVLLGNCGIAWLGGLGSDPSLEVLAEIGVVLLLFEVGLESRVSDLLAVGTRSLSVAVLGVATPWFLGWGLGAILLPQHSVYVHLFLGAVLTATSVGITARVLKDLGRAQTREARVILGAAVIDDILGLLILALVSGIIQAADLGGSVSFSQVLLLFERAALFLVVTFTIGTAVMPRIFRLTARLKGSALLLTTGLAVCFLLSYAASAVGLAPIVGAYAAGLILEESHFAPFVSRGERSLSDLVGPIASFTGPVFFVLMGLRLDLHSILDPRIAILSLALTLVAVLGKQACSLGALGGGLDALSVGIGMIPRGEVGLIFANIGLTLAVQGERIIDQGLYSAVILMVFITTLVTPPALKWSLARAGPARSASGG